MKVPRYLLLLLYSSSPVVYMCGVELSLKHCRHQSWANSVTHTFHFLYTIPKFYSFFFNFRAVIVM